MFLAAAGKTPAREQLAMHLPLLEMMSTEGTTTSSKLKTKIGRTIKMIFNTFDNDYHCTNVASNLPTIAPATIIDTLNCIWLNEGLDENMDSLNKYLTVINSCGHPSNP